MRFPATFAANNVTANHSGMLQNITGENNADEAANAVHIVHAVAVASQRDGDGKSTNATTAVPKGKRRGKANAAAVSSLTSLAGLGRT